MLTSTLVNKFVHVAGVEVTRMCSLRRHMRTQHADMWDHVLPEKCDQCERRFKDVEHLEK